MRRAIWKVGYILNVLVAIPLLLAYLSVHISPATLWPLAFFGLAYPIFLGLNLLFVIAWLVVGKRYFLLSLIVIALGWNHLRDFWGFHLGSDKEEGIALMTYNVRNFDLYNWSNNVATRSNMVRMLTAQQPDILCLQEFYSEKEGAFENVESLKQQLDLPHAFVHNQVQLRHGAEFGQATFSRFPIVKEGYINFDGTNNLCIYTDLVIEEDTIRVFNVHLQSTYLGSEGETYVQRLLQEQDADVATSRRVFSKLKKGYINRAPQAKIIATAIRESPHPVIVCGDFNDTPVSYTYHQLSSDLQDAFRAKGWGIGATFAGQIPWLRIDHVLVDNTIDVVDYTRISASGSDHYPVMVHWKKAN